MKDLRVVFMGTPEFSIPVLKMLYEKTNVVLVVTQMDKEVGRKRILTPSSVSVFAENNNIPIIKTRKIKENIEEILNYKPDIIITCAYGQIVPKQILDYPEYGCINVHASLLPKYRGASPISEAIKCGEEETGVTIMYMDEGLDTGNIIHSRSIKIDDKDTLGTLSSKLSELGASLLESVLPKILEDENFNIKQDDGAASYAKMIKREDEKIDFNKTRKEVYNQIRSLNPEPLAYTLIDGEEWKIIETEIGKEYETTSGKIVNITKDSFSITSLDGELIIKKIKRPGKKEMNVKDLFNGYKIKNDIVG